ncbi:MAG TPA: biotin carboxylase N-terminal domain-containing protein [Planctomycetaceae bacterium]|jgi:acetyl-CoA carboxylase biotin carboxylase subunit|nr:biotin carboxylase N-terminal domain-containing protein [Planctomycetaceae bacterium]
MAAGSINKILIANRGEIARRILRTCREMGIATVAVFSEADRDALFVQEAEEAVPLGGLRPSESYLRIEAVLDAARKTASDAIHPGYGFLAENAAFARACEEADIRFIGPPADVIAAMGSKIESKRRMQAADVPVLPSIEVSNQPADQVLRQSESLGWPLMIKASAGGGGRGMRVVRAAAEFASLLEVARQESRAAFGDGALFVEPYLEAARHIEIQILGDTHGNVVHLFERECSIQRRHQKLIEESPSLALDDELRRALANAALRAAKEIGYVNAGTVEFLLAPDGRFYFLEVNTRLQVEHPVTECVTGLDLVRLQILVAAGEPLPAEVHSAAVRGHAIEARLYAEDPRQDYLPSAGKLHRFRLPEGPGIRVDSAIGETAAISPYYDSLLAKVIAHAPTRAEAARRLSRALAGAQIHGLRTNRELLVRTLEHPDFQRGRTDTHFLIRNDPVALAAPLGDDQALRLHAAALALASQAQRRFEAKVLQTAPSGWRNNPSQFQQTRFQCDQAEISVEYRVERDGLCLRINGEQQPDLKCQAATPEQVRMSAAGVERAYYVHRVGETFYVDSPLGASVLVELPRFPIPKEETAAGSLVAPLPGLVNEVKAKKGDTVAAGDVVLVIESMKVFHWIGAPLAGRIAEIRVEAGSHVESGAVLAVIEPAT